MARVTGERHAKLLLLKADALPGLETNEPVDLAHIAALRDQHLLELQHTVAGKAVHLLPLPDEVSRRVIGDHVGHMADEDRVDIGVVIELQHREIIGGKKRGPLETRRQNQERGVVQPRFREGAPAHPHHPELDPIADWPRHVGTLQGTVEAFRQVYLVGPRLIAIPALTVQRVARGRQCVRDRFPNVTPAIAVEIHGIVLKVAGQKLGVPHGPCPRARHFRTRGLAEF